MALPPYTLSCQNCDECFQDMVYPGQDTVVCPHCHTEWHFDWDEDPDSFFDYPYTTIRVIR